MQTTNLPVWLSVFFVLELVHSAHSSLTTSLTVKCNIQGLPVTREIL